MSLSYTPKVEITPKTAKDICDDIWAGAIDFAEETGISTNPMVTTAIWSGLLISVKPTLEEHKLYEEVRKCFAASLDDVYHIGLGKVELLAELKYSMLTFCQNISENIGSFDTELKISAFLGLVSDVYSDCSSDPSPLPQNSVQLFSRYTFLLSSHIFEILYKTENSMVPQFQGIKYTQPQRKPVHAAADPKPYPRKAPVQQASKAPKSAKIPAFCWFIAGVLVVAILVVLLGRAVDAIYPSDISAESDVSVKSAYNTVTAPKVERPKSGTILAGKKYAASKITIHANSGSDCVVSLRSETGYEYVAFYVRAGESVTVGVPGVYLYAYFASGTEWFGYEKGLMFGEDTVYTKDEEGCDFETGAWEYTMYPVTDGNFIDTPIDEDDFF